jgi:pyruvate/2-oxoglutarate dehydrogenase complex dihydrolipoamide dehydrogenase (E3) component
MPEHRGEGLYNVVVIGAGTAGLVTAAGAAALGARVALVERGRMGGDCLNTGCVPSKALLSSARLASRMRRAADWGLNPLEPQIDFSRVLGRVRERRGVIAPHDSQERFEGLGVDVFRGNARFLSEEVVDVDGLPLRARNFVIAAGSRPRVPPIDGLKDVPYYTNETIFDRLEKKPGRLVVVGGGPIGCELGQAFARFGVTTAIVQTAPQILEKEDEDTAAVVRGGLQADGVAILENATVRMVARSDKVLRLWAELPGGERRPLDADTILVAAGREPSTDGLGLERAGVDVNENGIVVDEHLRTSQRHIFAAGDVAGSYRFTHVAEAQARTIVRNLLLPRWLARWDDSVVPWCTYTDPELARVGLSEREARERGVRYEKWSRPFADVDRAVVESRTEGFAKVLTAKGSDLILGAAIVGQSAGDLISEIALAMSAGLGLQAISDTIHPYPTFAEILRRTADERQKARLTPLARRVTRWLFRRRRRGA